MDLRPLMLVWIAAAVGCGTDSGQDYLPLPGGLRGAVHPNEEDRLSSDADVPVMRISIAAQEEALPPWLAPLATFDEGSTVDLAEATDSAPSHQEFGTLIDAEVATDGTVLLLDGSYSVIRVLNPSWEPIQVLGGEGEGPGELSRARTLFWLGPDELGAFGRGRIDGFRRENRRLEPSGRTPIPAIDGQSDACSLGGRLYVLGLRFMVGGGLVSQDSAARADPDLVGVAPEVIHQIGEAGEVLRSFSVPYRGVVPDPSLQRQLASAVGSGVLECAREHLWAGYSILGEVHAFSEDGRLAWIARVSDFDRPGYLFKWDASGQAAGMDIESGAFESGYFDETLDRVTLLSERVLAVQVSRTERGPEQEGFPETHTYRTYLLDPEDGHYLGGFTAEHQILGGGNGTAVLYREAPFPQVSFVRLEGG